MAKIQLEGARMLGDMGSPRAVAMAKRGFRHGHPPALVARAVVTAVKTNRAVVPAGIESSLGRQLAKITPVGLADLFGRPAPRLLTRGLGKP
jgi:hypothetical protein